VLFIRKFYLSEGNKKAPSDIIYEVYITVSSLIAHEGGGQGKTLQQLHSDQRFKGNLLLPSAFLFKYLLVFRGEFTLML